MALESHPVLWVLEASSLEVQHHGTSILYEDVWCKTLPYSMFSIQNGMVLIHIYLKFH
jgi:hypothetical protein